MSNLSITRGIVNNDHKGITGVGTIYWMEIIIGDERHYHEWGLLEEIRGTFSPEKITAPYKEEARRIQREQNETESRQKQEHMAKRKAESTVTPEIKALITEVCSGETKMVEDFKSGNAKSLNALVGRVIGKAKSKGLAPDAFSISIHITDHLR